MRFDNWLPVFGDRDFRGKCATETAEQVTFFNELRRSMPELGAIALHIRNEGKRTVQQVQQQKAEGMLTGAPDIVIPGTPSLLIELKRKDHTQSRWQQGQVEYLEAARAAGSCVCVALGYVAALEAVEAWRNDPNSFF